jgi:hypothetical protein
MALHVMWVNYDIIAGDRVDRGRQIASHHDQPGPTAGNPSVAAKDNVYPQIRMLAPTGVHGGDSAHAAACCDGRHPTPAVRP